MKTETVLLLGGAGLAALWLLGQRNGNGETLGESLGAGVGSGVAGAVVGVGSGSWNYGTSFGQQLAEQFNEAYFNPAVPSQNLINQGQAFIDDFTAGAAYSLNAALSPFSTAWNVASGWF